ncbi:ATP-binding protein [Actinomadura viridis]|uniref:ATP-binding protein n=1 Tax=Actinomadura viridis TaxID=58110 RepID=UPI0036A1F2FB
MSPGTLYTTCLAAGTVAAEMRQRIGIRLTQWGLSHMSADVLLVADELIVNVCRATPENEIRIMFTREPTSVLFAVWDASDDVPVTRPVRELSLNDITPDPRALDPGHDDGTGGWGLAIVQALSARCGMTKTDPRGKWVWARVNV